MNTRRFAVLAVSASLVMSCLTPIMVRAQDQSTQSTTASPDATTKQQQNAQRKAESKARRAKKNAELSQLEKNGYNPAQDQTNYPQNLQNAEQKLNAQKQGAKAAPTN